MAGRVGERRRRAPQLAGVVVRGGADGDAEAAREGGAVGEGRACYRHGRTADARADGGISARHVVRGVVHEFGRGHKLLAVEREVERAAADGAGRRRAIDVGQAVVRHADRRVDVDRVGSRAEEAADVERAAVRRARAQREVCAARRGAVRRGECVDRRRAEVGEGGGRRRELRAVEADGDGAIAGGGARWRLAAQPTAGVLRRHHRRERTEAAARCGASVQVGAAHDDARAAVARADGRGDRREQRRREHRERRSRRRVGGLELLAVERHPHGDGERRREAAAQEADVMDPQLVLRVAVVVRPGGDGDAPPRVGRGHAAAEGHIVGED